MFMASCRPQPRSQSAVASPVMMSICRDVQPRVSSEESHRLQAEPAVGDPRDRPVFGKWHMVVSNVIPEHQVSVLYEPVVFGVFGQASATGVLVGVWPDVRHLVLVVRPDP